MSVHRHDPLLTSARLLISLIMIIVTLGGVGATLGSLATLVFHSQASAFLASHVDRPVDIAIVMACAAVLAIVAAMAAIAWTFLRELRRIIDSVGQGDPFAPANSLRLARMGWLTVAVEAISIPAGIVGGWLTTALGQTRVDFGVSLSGVLLALILFILARVFRQGAAMREELDGTV
ncbi:MAG: DUF2975 domain-containing protein [Novosphingobium sp.]